METLLPDLPTRIHTPRLLLRPYQAGDGPWYFAMSQRNQAHLARYESGNPVLGLGSVESAELLVRDFAADWAGRKAFFLGAFERASGDFVAQIYLGVVSWELPEFELGFFAEASHQGQGYVSEASRAVLGWAFTYLGAWRVRLRCDDTNTRSIRVAERSGFTLEGRLRQDHRHTDGSLSGTCLYGVLKSEYQAQPAVGGAPRLG